MIQFSKTQTEILNRAASDAARLGYGSYIILVRRGGSIVAVADSTELQDGDEYISVTVDAKAGSQDPASLLIIGAGGMGFHLAMALSFWREYKIDVVDNDCYDPRRDGKLAVRPPRAEGIYKVKLLARYVAGNVRVHALDFDSYIASFPARRYRLVIDTTDLASAERVRIKEYAHIARAQYVRASYDVRGSRVIVSISGGVGFDTAAKGGRVSYTDLPTRARAMAAGALAAGVVELLLHGRATLPWIAQIDLSYSPSSASEDEP